MSSVRTKSRDEVIKLLKDAGIQVITKPVALVPTESFFYLDDKNSKLFHYEEMDIYDALEKLERHYKFNELIDPFK